MNKIKKGLYTTYKGKEYSISKNDGEYYLFSKDLQDTENGFVLYNRPQYFFSNGVRYKIDYPDDLEDIFCKKLNLSEVDGVYSIYTHAIYHGYDISIESSTQDTVLLATNDKTFYEKYGFEEVERFVYMKDVPFDEVELVEKRKPTRYIESAKTFVE